jgi:hypothetical protein
MANLEHRFVNLQAEHDVALNTIRRVCFDALPPPPFVKPVS